MREHTIIRIICIIYVIQFKRIQNVDFGERKFSTKFYSYFSLPYYFVFLFILSKDRRSLEQPFEVGVTRVIHSIPNSTPCSLLSLFSSIFPLASTFFEHVDREIREGFVDRKTDEKSNKITKKE